MSNIALLRNIEDQTAQWADFAAFYLGLTKSAGLGQQAIHHLMQNASDYGQLLKSPAGIATALAGAAGGAGLAHHLSKPREELGGKSQHEVDLHKKVEELNARGESPSLQGKLQDESVRTAHGVASAVRKHPNLTTVLGGVAGSAAGLGLMRSLMDKRAAQEKVALNFGGVGQALSRVNPAGLLGAGGALAGGALGAAGADSGHRLSAAGKGALMGGLGGMAAGGALHGNMGAARAAAGETRAAGAAAGRVPTGTVPHMPAGAAAAGPDIAHAKTMHSGLTGVTPAAAPSKPTAPLQMYGSSQEAILHNQGLLSKGVERGAHNDFSLQQALAKGSPQERQEILGRLRQAHPTSANILEQHFAKSQAGAAPAAATGRGRAPTAMTSAIPQQSMKDLVAQDPFGKFKHASAMDSVTLIKFAAAQLLLGGAR